MSLEKIQLGIECKECGRQWKANLALSGNTIEAFAAVCECGNLLVGNYHFELHKGINFRLEMTEIQKKKIFLNNGHFDIFTLHEDELHDLQELFLE